MQVIQATVNNIGSLVPLFDSYRVFYNQESNLSAAEDFLMERLHKNDSVILLAFDEDGKGVGFTQLYPSFSSVSMQRTYILNDLFVSSEARGKGVGEALLNFAKEFARSNNSKGLTLETDTDNPAQKLYERLGWVKDTEVFHYTWTA